MNDSQKESVLNKKIQQLTKELEYAKLKIISLETMITAAEDDLKIKIRKKRGTKQSKG
jgi:predicted  nucleic acid-binding Zn-ribbon protein